MSLAVPQLATAQNATDADSARSGAELGGEIIVTATRREERLSDVPISAAAISEEAIDQRGFRNFADIAQFVPGVEFTSGSNLVSIRGISTSAGAATTGLYIDDTPIQNRNIGTGRSQGAPELFDVQRVEVLRGPQGTLFGAGSMGGTVRYITPQPGLDEYSVYGRGGVSAIDGGDQGYELGAAVGGPIATDKIGFRVSAWHGRFPGYVDRIDYHDGVGANQKKLDDDTNWSDATILRAALKFAPTETLSVTPSVLFQSSHNGSTSSMWETYTDLDKGQYISGNPRMSSGHDRYVLPALAMELALPSVSIISNTSYFHRNQFADNDNTTFQAVNFGLLKATGPNIPGLPDYTASAEIQTRQRDFTQELRAQSTGDSPFSWVLGVFYGHNDQTSIEIGHDPMGDDFIMAVRGQTFLQRYGVAMIEPDMSFVGKRESTDEQIAGFADVTYALTDTLKINAGLRYAHTEFEFNSRQDGPYNGGLVVFSGAIKENPLTPKFNISYQPTRDHLFYATASKGYRVGGSVRPAPAAVCAADLASLGLTSAPPAYASDEVWSYEVGAKNSFFGNRLRTAASVYRIDWSKIQTSIYLPGCGFNVVINAATARSEGFDLQADFQATDSLLLSATVGYTDAKYTDSVATVAGTPRTIVNKGDTLGSRPWTATASADYNFPLAGEEGYIRGDFSYQSHNKGKTPAMDPVTTSYDVNATLPEATYLVNLRAGIRFSDWDVSAYVDNVFNAHPELSRFHETRSSPLYYITTFQPRTFGLTATLRQ